MHKHFLLHQVNKTNPRKEFFHAPLSDIQQTVNALGADAHWTQTAEAAQYRETLRIEERIATDPKYRQEWEGRQVVVSAWDEEEP